ncbi:MAG: DUF2157 domain-containing protein [Candidatus Competibacteraceae bacterium]|nr:DUF2157 domain-containing protein [Candidatus Competibacteraceae bacterium]
MNPTSRNRRIRRELDALLREGLLDETTHVQLGERYPVEGWDWRSLGRWFLIFGAISVMAGLVMLGRTLFEFTLEKLAILLSIAMLASFGGGQWLKHTRPTLIWSRLSLELLGGLLLIGLTFTLGAIYSTGSGNWPALLLIDLVLLLVLSYGLGNVLLLVLSAVVFFSWFGGFTGYASGWGAYWFGMNYPLRFLLAAMAMIAIAVIHQQSEQGLLAPYRGFFKIWLSTGLFLAEMALWLLSLFGNFDLASDWWYKATGVELILFNALWAGLNVALIGLGARLAMRMVTGYGATFLIIQIYTLFFAHLAEHLGLFLSLLIAGGGALALTFYLEKRRRES